jgi:DNA (cytosine-5)-methyltransferase 1
LSNGFSQAGFHVVAGLDKDKWAIETFRKNNPESEAIRSDILSIDPSRLPKPDVLIGGPPCIEFSSSKRGGNGNILEGLLLVQAFLRMVYFLKPRWWIMENVPRITRFLPEEVPLQWIGVKTRGTLPVPMRAVFNTADYGVPQARQRFLMGNFPPPRPTHFDPGEPNLAAQAQGMSPWRSLGEVLSGLPSPLEEDHNREVRDPNYGITVPVDQLTDQFHSCLLTDEEAHRIRRAKELHPFYGRMSFPDDLERPARTVVATQLGRETLVIGASVGGKPAFRRATVRECATVQTFPITYQFWGPLNVRYRLAGDAVPPMLSYAIACEILREEDRRVPESPTPRRQVIELSSPVPFSPPRMERKIFPFDRRFREFVPGKEVRGCRVDLDNQGTKPTHESATAKGVHLCEWVARLYVGEGKGVQRRRVTLQGALKELAGYCKDDHNRRQVLQFLQDLQSNLDGQLPDATSLQAAWCGLTDKVIGPYQVTDLLSAIVDRHFPKDRYHEVWVPRSGGIREVSRRGLRVRIVSALAATAYACELINNDPRQAFPGTNVAC